MNAATIFFLADDDADDIGMFCEALSEVDRGVVCRTAENGRSAIALLSDPDERKPDVIFLDINMPVLNGWDCLKWIKSQAPLMRIPVIMYSTSSSKRDIDLAAQHGALCLMTKPESYSGLKNILQLIMENIPGNLSEALRGLPNVTI
ncbi:MAG: response regulator [Chryseosolibacter sp.]